MNKLFKNAYIYQDNKKKLVNILIKDNKINQILKTNDFKDINIDEEIDLKRKILIPGFIDSFSEFYDLFRFNLMCNVKDSKTQKDFINKVTYYQNNYLCENDFLIIVGLNETLIKLNFINKNFLDENFPNSKIVIYFNQSNKFLLNTNASKYINNKNKDIKIKDDGFVEQEYNELLDGAIPERDEQSLIKVFNLLQEKVIKSGITTLSIKLNSVYELSLFQQFCFKGLMKIDYIIYLNIENFNLSDYCKMINKNYYKHLKIIGFYVNLFNEITSTKKQIDEIQLKSWIDSAIKNNYQLVFVDNSCENLIEEYKSLFNQFSNINKNDPNIIIDSNFITNKTISSLNFDKFYLINSTNIIWSLNVKDLLPLNILDKLCLNKDFIDNNINLISSHKLLSFNFNLFESIWSLVNRKTKTINRETYELSYEVINKKQELDINEALNTFTLYGANLLDELKQGIKPNNVADFIVLDQDIYEIDSSYLSTIKVHYVFKDGIEIYHSNKINE